MKYLKKFEQKWVGPPPEWDEESDYSDEQNSVYNTFDSLSRAPKVIRARNIDKIAFDYSNSLVHLVETAEEYFETDDFVLIPTPTHTRADELLAMSNFRDMVNDSELYVESSTDSKESDVVLWEWNGIKGIDYTVDTDTVLDEEFTLEGMAITTEIFNKLRNIPKKVILNEDVVIEYLNGSISLDDLKTLQYIV